MDEARKYAGRTGTLDEPNSERRALLTEMRQLVRIWNDGPLEEAKAEVIRLNPLNKATRARVVDVLNWRSVRRRDAVSRLAISGSAPEFEPRHRVHAGREREPFNQLHSQFGPTLAAAHYGLGDFIALGPLGAIRRY